MREAWYFQGLEVREERQEDLAVCFSFGEWKKRSMAERKEGRKEERGWGVWEGGR